MICRCKPKLQKDPFREKFYKIEQKLKVKFEGNPFYLSSENVSCKSLCEENRKILMACILDFWYLFNISSDKVIKYIFPSGSLKIKKIRYNYLHYTSFQSTVAKQTLIDSNITFPMITGDVFKT